MTEQYYQVDLFGNKLSNNLKSTKSCIFEDDDIIDRAYSYHIANGFPFVRLPVYVSMQEINKLYRNTNFDTLKKSRACTKVADTYHPHRLRVTCWNHISPYDGFHIEKKLRKALRVELKSGGIPTGYPSFLSIVSGVRAASNFRPAYASYIYRKYCKEGDTVLDTSSGFGGRLVGFIASGILGKYIGIDPSTLTHEGNSKIIEDLGSSIDSLLLQKPAEDVSIDELPKVDVCFTSPPYFDREYYSEELTQSYKRYTAPELWKTEFLRPMVQLQYNALKSGGYNIINISDIKYDKTHILPLEKWTIEIAKDAGFELINTEQYTLNIRPGCGCTGELPSEPVFIFKK